MKTIKLTSILLAFLLTILSSVSFADSGEPTAQLRSTLDKVIDTLKDKSLVGDARRDKIRELINDRFYFRAMSQRTLSRNWKKASSDQQTEFTNLFSKLLEKTYIGRIEAYTDERVEYLREKSKNKKRSVVYTHIVTKTNNIPINYKLALKGGKWLVYDIVIEEVSLISNYRTSYATIIKKNGMDGLLSQMKAKLSSQS